MHYATTVLIAVCFASIGLNYWAGKIGAGVPQPTKNPPSIREGSTARGTMGRGHHRTRFFFVGGGLRGGK